ncbi:hypothetical protein [Nonomuraea sp. NPDC050310]|uniref:hypothetical protein n=1 Tax=Nonomuraea sp. NPDC050310 TaxID=3154935 RepID=UPI0033C736CB
MKRLEAVLAVRDEELATVRKAYTIVLGQLKATRAEYGTRTREMVEELHRADAAEATLARVRDLHHVHRCATDGHTLARTPVPCVNDGICRCGAADCPTLAALDSEGP